MQQQQQAPAFQHLFPARPVLLAACLEGAPQDKQGDGSFLTLSKFLEGCGEHLQAAAANVGADNKPAVCCHSTYMCVCMSCNCLPGLQHTIFPFFLTRPPGRFSLGAAKVKVLKALEDTLPAPFVRFYSSPLFDRLLHGLVLYFCALFQHELLCHMAGGSSEK